MKKLLILLSIVSLQACSVQGLTSDYSKLSDAQRANIVPVSDFSQAQPGKIYKISGAQLKAELEKHAKSIVYVFTNGCTSNHCKPLITYEYFAKRNGYDLFLVMNGYRDLGATLEQPINSPLYAIDNDYYNSVYRAVYVDYFTNDLLGKPLREKKKEYLGNLYFFTGSKLEKITEELPQG